MEQVIIIGAGPCGLAAAAECKDAGIDALVIEKGSIVNSIYHYPTFLQFHSTAELLEIGGIPFVTPNEKPTRQEGLTYYRTVAERKDLRIRGYETVTSVRREEDGIFTLTGVDRHGRETRYRARNVIMATGYFDYPNHLGIPGEELPKVSHYYREAHPYAGMKVAVVGGNNSAVDAALDLKRVGAEVTVIYRREELSARVKSWVRPVFQSMLDKGHIRMLFSSRLIGIREYDITVESAGGAKETIANDFVLALTGFRPDRTLLQEAGVRFADESGVPIFNAETMETEVPGLYIAGVVAAGNRANEIFIETGRYHGKQIVKDLKEKL